MNNLDKLVEAVEGGFPDWGLMEHDLFDGGVKQEIRAAYHGSLDAALALHESLLPGWGWQVYSNGGAMVRLYVGYEVYGNGQPPARAWLLAILKAYRTTLHD